MGLSPWRLKPLRLQQLLRTGRYREIKRVFAAPWKNPTCLSASSPLPLSLIRHVFQPSRVPLGAEGSLYMPTYRQTSLGCTVALEVCTVVSFKQRWPETSKFSCWRKQTHGFIKSCLSCVLLFIVIIVALLIVVLCKPGTALPIYRAKNIFY